MRPNRNNKDAQLISFIAWIGIFIIIGIILLTS